MSESVALVLGMTEEAPEADAMGTDVVGFRSGRGRVSVTVVGFRSGRGRVPVTVGVLGMAAVSGAGATPDGGTAS